MLYLSPSCNENENFPVQASDSGRSNDCGSIVPSSYRPSISRFPSNIVTNVASFRTGVSESAGNGAASTKKSVPKFNGQRPRSAGNPSAAPDPKDVVHNRNSKPPRHPDYATYRVRLESYTTSNWDETTKPNPTLLAEWGLYATGRGDLVRCFHCGLGLKHWIKDDDPLAEHVKHSSSCEFVQEQLGLDKFRRLKESLTSNETSNGYHNEYTGAVQRPGLHYPIRHPKYQTVAERQQSFLRFPCHVTQTAKELALAGFFFTGEGDICRCFTCDGGLKNWTPGHDPFEEHAKYFPQCPYMKQLKGETYIEMVQRRFHNRNETFSAAPPPQFPPATSVAMTTQVVEQLAVGDRRPQDMPSNATEIRDDLQTPAAKSVLEMGYSNDVVARAIIQLKSKGNAGPSAQDIMELILDYEDRDDTPSRNEDKDEGRHAEHETLVSMMRCVLCKKEERNILCLPCQHHRMCAGCAANVTHCPTCSRYIKQKIKTFMS